MMILRICGRSNNLSLGRRVMSNLDLLTDFELEKLDVYLAGREIANDKSAGNELLRRCAVTIKHLQAENLELSRELEDCQSEL